VREFRIKNVVEIKILMKPLPSVENVSLQDLLKIYLFLLSIPFSKIQNTVKRIKNKNFHSINVFVARIINESYVHTFIAVSFLPTVKNFSIF
jgi:hypothetical protein